MHHKQWHLHPDALFVCVSSAKSSVSLFHTKIMQFTQIQILFKAITLFHSLHLQQDEVSLALHTTSATIMKTHQHAKNLILQPLMLEPEEYRERFVINTWLQCSFYTLSWKKNPMCFRSLSRTLASSPCAQEFFRHRMEVLSSARRRQTEP